MSNVKKRCCWVSDDPLYINYHDNEWGIPIYNERLLFEFLILEGMQAGLSWLTILKRRKFYRELLDNFSVEKIASYSDKKLTQLLANPKLIRNKLKINSIRNNAQALLDLKNKGVDFSDYLWRFVAGQPVINHWRHHDDVPVSTLISEEISQQLKKDGFNFVGPTICYAFMQAVGMVNDHTLDCFLRENIL